MANFLDLTTGMPALWAKIKSKFYTKAEVDALIPEDEVMVVNITYDNNSSAFVADKTYTETEAAWSAGKIVYAKDDSGHSCIYNGAYFEGTYHDEDFARRIEYHYNHNSNYELDYFEPPIVEQSWVSSYYLNKYNTTSYTPTADYNPATKKYVDDSIPLASTTTPYMDGTASYGSSIYYARADHRHPSDTNKENKAVTVSVTISGSTATVGSPLTAEYMYENFGKRNIYLRDSYRGDIYSLVNYDYDEDEGGVLAVFISKDSSSLGGGDNYTVKVVKLGYTDEKSDSTWVGDYYIYENVSISDVLTKTNTTSYTPSANYHPATKKYVDDSIGSITVPTASTTTPLMDGTATIGSSTNYAKADHVHPSDTSKLTRHVSRSGGLEHSTISNLYNQFTVQVANDGGGLVNNFTLTPTSTTINNVVTPTSDGMAANKKYVDDAVGAVSTSVSELTDTTISSPANGQVLTYNNISGKWENVAVPKEVLYGTVTISGTSATFSSAITGYAIASGNKEVIVRHSATGDIYKLIYFESESGICYFRFNCVTATDIKSISGSGNSSSSGTTALTGTYSIKPILDTNISSPSAGQVLQYDATNNTWVNATLPTGVTETRVNELIAAALAQYGDGDTATYGYTDASEVNY